MTKLTLFPCVLLVSEADDLAPLFWELKLPHFEQWVEPLFSMFDPSKRLFFVYMLSAFTIGGVTLFFQKKGFLEGFNSLLNPKIWMHRSTHIDLQLFVFNSLLKTLLFTFVVAHSMLVARWVNNQLLDLFPNHSPAPLSYSTIVGLYTIISFLALDFSRFFQHYLFHKIPFLWQFHKVHHSAEVLTPLTLYRTHPVESVLSTFRRILVVGLVSGVFIFYTRSVIGAWAIFGVNLFDFAFNALGSNLRHSHVWLSFGPLNHFWISPAQHQIHHSRAEKHFDKNLGVALAIWDKMFGTFYQVHKKEFLIFGIRGEIHKTFKEALLAPLPKSKRKPQSQIEATPEFNYQSSTNLQP